jgi:outer membrane receptor protein involved in Fe transport
MSRNLAAFLFVLCLAVTFGVANAMTTGFVRGTVTLDGKPAEGATITLTGEGSRFVTTADAKGHFTFDQVPFGSYTLTADDDAAPSQSVTISVSSSSVTAVDIALGHLLQIAHATVLASSEVGGKPVDVNRISKAQILASPVENSLNQLIETLPGVVRFSYNEPVALGFHGVTYEIDGAPLPLATSSNFAEVVDPKDVDSMEVYTGDFPAEYGGQRMGALVNIITNRPGDFPPGNYGELTGGVGYYGQALGQFYDEGLTGNTQYFLDLNSERTNYGIDAPTSLPYHDVSSQSDEFFRTISQINNRSTLAFDFGNQFSLFQIPINPNANDPTDPEVSPVNTDDVQREYDQFSSLNYTLTSQDGNGTFQIVPWYRMTQIIYAGDLRNDVLSSIVDPVTGAVDHLIGLDQNRNANYEGLRIDDFRATGTHAWKVGIDVDRENFNATQTFACYYLDCTATGTPVTPYYALNSAQAQAGSNFGAYAEDTWTPIPILSVQYGMRFDHSTGYVGGYMPEPRIGVNVQVAPKTIFHTYYGRMYAAPQLEDVRQACVLLGAGSGECPKHPVYNLQPERDDLFEVGLQHTFSSEMTGYVNYDFRRVINVLDTTQLLDTPLFAVFNNALGVYHGIDLRLQSNMPNGNLFYVTATISVSVAGGISGSTFLFGPAPNPPGVSLTCPCLLTPEDHSQLYQVTSAYTSHFGNNGEWFATLLGQYGSGYPVAFENATENLTGTLPAHTTFDASIGRVLMGTPNHGLALRLDIQNMLNHQYIIKIANGFNTTQYAFPRTVLLRLTQAF